MLSYKQWKTLNESILPSFTLGLGQPTNLGLQSAFGLGLEESKKAAKKKSLAKPESRWQKEASRPERKKSAETIQKKPRQKVRCSQIVQ